MLVAEQSLASCCICGVSTICVTEVCGDAGTCWGVAAVTGMSVPPVSITAWVVFFSEPCFILLVVQGTDTRGKTGRGGEGATASFGAMATGGLF